MRVAAPQPDVQAATRPSDFVGMVAHFRDRVAVRDQRGTATFGEIGTRAAALAQQLRDRGVKEGDPVAVQLRNQIPAVWASYGTTLARACEVQLNSGLAPAERQHCLSLVPARIAICNRQDAADFTALGCEVVAVEDIGRGDIAAIDQAPIAAEVAGRINFTSGTTGAPKAIVATHASRWLGNLLFRSSLPALPGADSSILLFTPFSHGAGLFTQAYLSLGASVTLIDGMDMPFIERCLTDGSVDAMFAPPTALAKLTAGFTGRKYQSLRTIFSGTAVVPRPLYEAIAAMFGPVLCLTYGKTEVHSPIAQMRAEETHAFYTTTADAGDSCLGWPAPGVEIAIRGDAQEASSDRTIGEICVRARHMTSGWIDAQGFHDWGPDGWHATGDLGYIDGRGCLRLLGRANDVIKTGGYKIFPAEIELAAADAGLDITVVGYPSAYWGEIIVAVSATDEDVRGSAAQGLNDRLATFKHPRAFLVIDQMPRNAQGKVVRKSVLQALASRYTLIDGPHPRFEPKG